MGGICGLRIVRVVILPRFLRRQFFARLLLGLSFLLSLGLAIQLDDRLLGIFRQPVVRITVQEFLEDRPRLLRIVQVVLIDLADSEQRIAAILAPGIFLAQEAVLGNRLF